MFAFASRMGPAGMTREPDGVDESGDDGVYIEFGEDLTIEIYRAVRGLGDPFDALTCVVLVRSNGWWTGRSAITLSWMAMATPAPYLVVDRGHYGDIGDAPLMIGALMTWCPANGYRFPVAPSGSTSTTPSPSEPAGDDANPNARPPKAHPSTR